MSLLIRTILTGWGGRECWKGNMCLNLEAKPGLVLHAVGVVHSLIVQMINHVKLYAVVLVQGGNKLYAVFLTNSVLLR